ncbi:MAG: carbohydrate ABC transporter permease [Firmicutes bacterium]|nr:carbohydrate ABC transporter permease [Bacillota bacterium]
MLYRRIAECVLVFILCIIALVYLVPFLWTAASALRPAGPMYSYANPLTLETFIPKNPTLQNFFHIFTKQRFGRAMFNSLFVGTSVVALGLLVNSMAGFAFAKFDFPLKNLFFALVLLTFMVPFESIVIPLYVVVQRMGISNTYSALILPAIANGMAIFLFRQFFADIPTELLEAARVDGASWARVFFQFLLPLSKPALVSVMIMLFLFNWNALFWPLVAVHSSDLEVVQVAVTTHVAQEETHWANLFSSAFAASLPPMLLFLFLQRYFVRGISGTGLK